MNPCAIIVIALGCASVTAAPKVYEPKPDSFGNRIPDFSLAGYRYGGIALPVAPVITKLQPSPGSSDDTERIQSVIDKVARLQPRAADGIKGAVLLDRGTFRCNESLKIPPGVTLRGCGPDPGGTVIIATMIPKEGSKPTLIRMEGDGQLARSGPAQPILDETLPLGSTIIRVDKADGFKAGDSVIVERTATSEWIHDLRMDRIELSKGGNQWTPAGYRVAWAARVTAVRGQQVALDTPVICSIERRYGGGALYRATDSRKGGAGVENLRLESVYQTGRENSDECHAWTAISINRIVDSWVRDVTAVHFAYSCVSTGKSAARITVQDCAMLDPVSTITGGRRYSFVGGGQFVLFQRCYARNGRHDFVTGHLDVGPTVFLDCLAEQTHADIGPHHRWACGQLYDNVHGGSINVQDRGGSGTGHGWAGNCQVLWNCTAKTLICQQPWLHGTQNWAIGCTAAPGKPAEQGRPDGIIASPKQPVSPRSLYLNQLAARVSRNGGDGAAAVNAVITSGQRDGTIRDGLSKRHRAGNH
jgi:hypothetical protein